MKKNCKYTCAVAGIGYVGLSISILLAQHCKVYALDIDSEKIELINRRQSPMLSLFLTNHAVQTKDYLKTMGENTLLILCVHLLELRIFPWYLIKNFMSEKLIFAPWLTAAVVCLFKISIATIAVTVKRKIRSYSCKYKKSL